MNPEPRDPGPVRATGSGRAAPAGSPVWPPVAALLPAALLVGYALNRVPLAEALQFGPDEGYELIKASLVAAGHPLYSEVWNDQPPLFTVLLAALFRITGAFAGPARLLALGFASALILGLTELVRRTSGVLAGFAAAAVFLTWTEFLPLSVSAMLEIPMLALGLAAYLLARVQAPAPPGIRTGLAGVVFGLAVETKLIAVLFLPAILAELALHSRAAPGPAGPGGGAGTRSRDFARRLGCWGLGAAACLATTALLFPGQLGSMFGTHAAALGARSPAAAMGLRMVELTPLETALTLGLFSAFWLLIRGEWRISLGPLTFGATVVALHLFTRPYWTYYGLHFLLAAAWLFGAALRDVPGILEAARRQPGIGRTAAIGALTGVLILAIGSLGRAAFEATRAATAALRRTPRIRDSAVIDALRNHADARRWILTDSPIHAFQAGLLIPPEIAVVPLKRLWADPEFENTVIASLDRFAPTQTLLIHGNWPVGNLGKRLTTQYLPRPEIADGYYVRR